MRLLTFSILEWLAVAGTEPMLSESPRRQNDHITTSESLKVHFRGLSSMIQLAKVLYIVGQLFRLNRKTLRCT